MQCQCMYMIEKPLKVLLNVVQKVHYNFNPMCKNKSVGIETKSRCRNSFIHKCVKINQSELKLSQDVAVVSFTNV